MPHTRCLSVSLSLVSVSLCLSVSCLSHTHHIHISFSLTHSFPSLSFLSHNTQKHFLTHTLLFLSLSLSPSLSLSLSLPLSISLCLSFSLCLLCPTHCPCLETCLAPTVNSMQICLQCRHVYNHCKPADRASLRGDGPSRRFLWLTSASLISTFAVLTASHHT